MTTRYATHCFGRHTLQFPPDATLAQTYQLWGSPITRLSTQFDVATLVARREAELLAMPHQKQANMLVKKLALPEGSGGLLSYEFAHTEEFQNLELWLPARPPTRIWAHKSEVTVEKQDSATAYASYLARTIRGRGPNDVPTASGFCIDGGVIGGREFQSEGYTVHASFPSMPRVTMKLFSQVVSKPQDKLLDRAPAALSALVNAASGTRTLRRGERSLNGIQGQELLLAVRVENKRGHYFRWESPGKAQSMEHPALAIELTTLSEPDDKGSVDDSFFNTDEEAMAFWDSIVDTVRVWSGSL